MPTYSEPDMTVTVDGITLEPVGGAYDKALLTDLLRGKYGFKGVILSDWLIADDCDANCINGVSSGSPSFVGWACPGDGRRDPRAAFHAGGQRRHRPVRRRRRSERLIDAVNRGQLSEDRLSESAYRVLLQKFQQGLFDHPYVDADAAGKIVGNADFQARHSMRSAARWCCCRTTSCCR